MSQFFEPPEGAILLHQSRPISIYGAGRKKRVFVMLYVVDVLAKPFWLKLKCASSCTTGCKWNVSVEDEIWYAAPTFKQAKRVFWKRLNKRFHLHGEQESPTKLNARSL